MTATRLVPWTSLTPDSTRPPRAVTFASDPEADASALARLPYKSQVVAAVGGTTAMTPSTDLLRHSPEGDAALAAYLQIGSARQSLTEGVDAQFKPVPARIDLLD